MAFPYSDDPIPVVVTNEDGDTLGGSIPVQVEVATAARAVPAFHLVAVLQAATRLDAAPTGRSTIEVQNLGPHEIWIQPGGVVVPVLLSVGVGRRLVYGESVALDLSDAYHLWAIAETADQVAGGMTGVMEI
jgi:hypothetical protein